MKKYPVEVRRSVLAISEGRSGQLVEAILDEARNPDSPLHPWFEWDDSAAAEKYRRLQAGRLIAVVVRQADAPKQLEPVKVAVRIMAPAAAPKREPEVRIIGTAGLRTALAELQQWMFRHKGHAELAELYERIHEAVAANAETTPRRRCQCGALTERDPCSICGRAWVRTQVS